MKKDGALCPCGREGCLEAYAGRGSMEAKARREVEHGRKSELFKIMESKGRTRLSSGVWAKAVEEGDELAIELIDRAISYLGAGIGSAVNLLDPEAVVIGGGMGVRFGEAYLERIRDATMPHVFADERPPARCSSPRSATSVGRPGRRCCRPPRRDRRDARPGTRRGAAPAE